MSGIAESTPAPYESDIASHLLVSVVFAGTDIGLSRSLMFLRRIAKRVSPAKNIVSFS